MTPPSWAYQADNFDPPPDEELICSVCRSVFCDPVQSPCNHVFCRTCINRWLESNRNCPICRKRTTKYTVQEVVPIVKNMIMKLTLYCHNKEKGCKEKFTLESCEGHLKVCSYEKVRCSNKPCRELLMRKDLEDHELNNCLYRYIRCQTCTLKLSPNGHIKHNCIKDLKKRLRAKNELIKIKNQKIRELQAEIKHLKEVHVESSDMSSLESLSAGDVMISINALNDTFDSAEYISDSDDYSSQLANYLDNSFRDHVFEDFMQDNSNDSIEYPRSSDSAIDRHSTPAAHGNSTASNHLESTDDEPQVRRPIKRRLPVRTLDSSEEDNDIDVEPPPAPSPKRTPWCRVRAEAGQSSSQAAADVLQSAPQSIIENDHLPSSSTASCSRDEAQSSHSNIPFKLRPSRVMRSSTDQVTVAPVSRNSRAIFERTRALLEQYSLESDPEWLPPNPMHVEDVQYDSDSSYRPPVYPDDHFSTSSDSSSSEGDSSSDSSYVDAQSMTNMLSGLYSTSSSDDPDWIPSSK
ncbi:uncharacterized protein LOC129968623 [Argiope bruennichi]|uniref:E3 ubiquitin-protein ligase PDZRN3-B like protein n=1 Tax=Argiope bruennichi TaxID=94029 RepID=A0A8T0FPG1_ARGBR|nr:uncharacterized protein LOC129968623 [Argiope bruennichi]KAF8792971.1 E3 ubiquitin-protein ligase PDZRN3-B like protein [Argiope bruennichi]